MASRRIYLPSPREPSGATWLINCLLELGVRTFRYSPGGMWRREKGRWLLNPHERVLRKWLPALSDHDSFDFRDDVEVQWMHEWRSKTYTDSQVVYFVRDPRDALFSRYKREAPQLSFAEFAAFPDVRTLLDKVVNWKLFNEGWLSHPRLTVVRFEDYKADAGRTLRQVLHAMGLEYGPSDIDRAVRTSTYDRAAAAERAYRTEHPEDTQIINRSGLPMEWHTGEIDRGVIVRIESLCFGLLERLGYSSPAVEHRAISLDRHLARLRFFGQVALDHAVIEPAGEGQVADDAFRRTIDFAMALNPDLLTRASLPAYELAQLKASLGEYLASVGSHIEDSFARAVPSPVPPDTEVMPLERLKRGLLRRARRLIGAGA
jgi:hypothetical protein